MRSNTGRLAATSPMAIYFVLLMLPIYWMVLMSLRPNQDITGEFTWWPDDLSLDNYRTIFTDRSWY